MDQSRLANLIVQLSDASLSDPRTFAEAMANTVKEELGCEAVTLYINSPDTRAIRLRAAAGFDYDQYQNFQIGLDTLAGRAVETKDAHTELDLANSVLFADKGLLPRTAAICGTSLPLLRPPKSSIDAPDVIGVICIYHKEKALLESTVAVVRALEPLLSRLYVASVEQWFHQIRTRTVQDVAFEQRLGELCDTFLGLITDQLTFEAGSIFVLDESRDRIYLRGTTGLKDHSRNDISFPSSAKNIIAQAISQCNDIVHSPDFQGFDPAKVPEELDTELRNGIAVPLSLPTPVRSRVRHDQRRAGIGSMILLNNYAEFLGRRQVVDVTWEERCLAEFTAEMLSVLIFQSQKAKDLENNYERLLHGASQTLQGSLFSIEMFLEAQNRLEPDKRAPVTDTYWLQDAATFVADIQYQLIRGEMVDQAIATRPLPIYKDVLVSLRPLVKRMARARGLGPCNFTYESESGAWDTFPPVVGNTDALQCVFRNLVDNALKYRSDDPGPMKITVTGSYNDRLVRIRVANNGLAITDNESLRLFEDGFRGPKARLRTPSGIGKGLADCRLIMKKLRGDINYVGRRDGLTIFEVVLERL